MSYIYIIKEREFIRLNEEVYKVGITKELSFPKGSQIVFCTIIDETKMKDIIVLFKFLFENTEYGEEYFKGDVKDMILVVNSIIRNIKDEQIKSLETKLNEVNETLNSAIISRNEFFNISEKQNIILQQQKIDLEKVLKENEELKAKLEDKYKPSNYKIEYDNFFKKILKKADNYNYDKVYLVDLHVVFNSWCKAKCISKLPSYDEFYNKVEEQYKIKTTDNEPNEYLEMIEYKV